MANVAAMDRQPLDEVIQSRYPDPPLVLMISNNEHAKQTWSEVETSTLPREVRPRQAGDFKRKVVGDGWIERDDAPAAGKPCGRTGKYLEEERA